MTYNVFGGTLSLTQSIMAYNRIKQWRDVPHNFDNEFERIATWNWNVSRVNETCALTQWRRQRSKGARSFRGQKILKPGHPESGA